MVLRRVVVRLGRLVMLLPVRLLLVRMRLMGLLRLHWVESRWGAGVLLLRIGLLELLLLRLLVLLVWLVERGTLSGRERLWWRRHLLLGIRLLLSIWLLLTIRLLLLWLLLLLLVPSWTCSRWLPWGRQGRIHRVS